MPDGHLNKCKSCAKIDSKSWYKEKSEDPAFVEKEKDRAREKYHRLGYRETKKPDPDKRKLITDRYKDKFPEKYKAGISSQRIRKEFQENQLHHWSYNQEHWKDVIELTISDHNLLHRHIIYDQERMMYRRSDNNQLLDTKESHYQYFLLIKENDRI